jgi:hypothetical protein
MTLVIHCDRLMNKFIYPNWTKLLFTVVSPLSYVGYGFVYLIVAKATEQRWTYNALVLRYTCYDLLATRPETEKTEVKGNNGNTSILLAELGYECC